MDSSPELTRKRLGHYLDEVVRWGNRVDLTAARDLRELVDLSLADAAVMARVELEAGHANDVFIDVGTGGGAPGIPLFILLAAARGSNLRGSLVEPRSKRTAFLRSVVGGLELPEVIVERKRSDVLPARSADVALARATLPPSLWLREGARLSRRVVWLLLAKEDAPEFPELSVTHDLRYEWPLTGAKRRAIRYIQSVP